MSGRVILLVGMMGAGKSAVGRAISESTGWPYVDNDALVEQATGSTSPEILAAGGEEALRAAESDALQRALALQPPAVAGLAGGVVLDPVNCDRLRAAPAVVWLRARLDTLTRRVGSGAGRPWLQPHPATAIARLAAAREPSYAQVADAIVDVDDLTPEEAAEAVVRAVRKGGSLADNNVLHAPGAAC